MAGDPGREQRELIDQRIRKLTGQPVVRDTGQAAPASPSTLARTEPAAWLVEYRATCDELPQDDAPPWAEHHSGSPEVAVGGGVLSVVVDDGYSESEYWGMVHAGFAPASELEAFVRINSAASAVNQGSALALFNGAWQFVVWLRAAGLNIDGQVDVAVTLSDDYHRVRLVTTGEYCEVYVDGEFMQAGYGANVTSAKGVTFGSYTTKDAFA